MKSLVWAGREGYWVIIVYLIPTIGACPQHCTIDCRDTELPLLLILVCAKGLCCLRDGCSVMG